MLRKKGGIFKVTRRCCVPQGRTTAVATTTDRKTPGGAGDSVIHAAALAYLFAIE